MSKILLRAAALAGACAFAQAAFADVVVLKDGDRVTGQVVSAAVEPSLANNGGVLVRGDAGLRDQFSKAMFSTVTLSSTWDNQPAPGARDVTTRLLFGVGYAF
jgi:hypothetical protein